MLHFNTPRPVLEFAKTHACFTYLFERFKSLDSWPLFRTPPALLPSNGSCSSEGPSVVAPSSPIVGPNVTFRLTRRPVLGMIRVACRS